MNLIETIVGLDNIVTSNNSARWRLRDSGVLSIRYDAFDNLWEVHVFMDSFVEFCKVHKLQWTVEPKYEVCPDTRFLHVYITEDQCNIKVFSCGSEEDWKEYGVYMQE